MDTARLLRAAVEADKLDERAQEHIYRLAIRLEDHQTLSALCQRPQLSGEVRAALATCPQVQVQVQWVRRADLSEAELLAMLDTNPHSAVVAEAARRAGMNAHVYEQILDQAHTPVALIELVCGPAPAHVRTAAAIRLSGSTHSYTAAQHDRLIATIVDSDELTVTVCSHGKDPALLCGVLNHLHRVPAGVDYEHLVTWAFTRPCAELARGISTQDSWQASHNATGFANTAEQFAARIELDDTTRNNIAGALADLATCGNERVTSSARTLLSRVADRVRTPARGVEAAALAEQVRTTQDPAAGVAAAVALCELADRSVDPDPVRHEAVRLGDADLHPDVLGVLIGRWPEVGRAVTNVHWGRNVESACGIAKYFNDPVSITSLFQSCADSREALLRWITDGAGRHRLSGEVCDRLSASGAVPLDDELIGSLGCWVLDTQRAVPRSVLTRAAAVVIGRYGADPAAWTLVEELAGDTLSLSSLCELVDNATLAGQ